MFSQVLVAVDGSPASFHAAKFASLVARPDTGTEGVHLVCVTDRTHPPAPAPLAEDISPKGRCELALASAQAAIGKQAVVRSRVVAAPPALEAILQRAADVGAELLCVGSGTRRLRLGSLSAALTRQSPTSLAILREGIASTLRLATIVVGVDSSEGAVQAARRMLAWAGRSRAAIHLRWVVPDTSRLPAEGVELDDPSASILHGTAGAGALRSLRLDAADGASPPASVRILPGEPADRLLQEALHLGADMVVVGSLPKRRRRDAIGSVGARLAAQSPVPLLIIR